MRFEQTKNTKVLKTPRAKTLRYTIYIYINIYIYTYICIYIYICMFMYNYTLNYTNMIYNIIICAILYITAPKLHQVLLLATFVVCLLLFASLGIAFTISSLPSYHDPIKRCNSMGFSVACRLAILAMALTGQVDELLETTKQQSALGGLLTCFRDVGTQTPPLSVPTWIAPWGSQAHEKRRGEQQEHATRFTVHGFPARSQHGGRVSQVL